MSLVQLSLQLSASKQRGFIHLQGDQTWCHNWLKQHLAELPDKDVLWFGDTHAAASTEDVKHHLEIRLKQYKKYLGQERDILVIDAYAGFNPDALGALAGIVKLGGMCVLLTPNNETWVNYLDPELTRFCTEPFVISDITQAYSQRLVNLLTCSSDVIQISQQHSIFPKLIERQEQPLTHEQTAKLIELEKLVTGANSSSLAAVIQADRGRGKSSLMGLLSANLLAGGLVKEILVTAPLAESVGTLFYHCQQHLEQNGFEVSVTENKLVSAGGTLSFIAPDKLMLEQPQADLLLVDEAAAIPIQMLSPLIQKYKKAIYATTIHGYEGTGRGFEYKLKPLLKSSYDECVELALSQPIRWYKDDNLERVVNRLLALDIEVSDVRNKDLTTAEFKLWHQSELLNNESKLTEIFALLVNAHYRTSPSDLRQMLDGPNIFVVTLEQQGQTLAAALIAKEGSLSADLCEQIWQGRRRPRGHLFPQSLIAHAGFKSAGKFSYHRVIRIATHPELQNKGLGSTLLADIELWSKQNRIDFLSTSYGYSDKLFSFWQASGLIPARLGLKQEASTGEYSLLMFKPLKDEVKSFAEQVNARFGETYALEQKFHLRTQSIALPESELKLNLEAKDIQDLIALSEHFRGINTCLLAMCRFVYTTKENANIPRIIEDKCSTNYSDKELINKYKLSGEKELVGQLRQEWKRLLSQHAAIEVNPEPGCK